LARFAYTPLIPALVAEQWFQPSEIAYLGAANLAGYIAGALLARRLAEILSMPTTLRAMMLLAGAAFFACAWPFTFLWFFLWRFSSGLAGGALMVLAAPFVLPYVPPARRGLAGGVIFMGVGLGIAASGTLVPLLLRQGLSAAWCGLGALAFVLTAITWTGWPRDTISESRPINPETGPKRRTRWQLATLYVEYGLNAAGLVPHMVFLVDFIARGLQQGLQTGALYWILFGLGAMCGPLLTGSLGDRIGFRRALRAAFLVQALFVALPAFIGAGPWLMMSSFVIGAFTPGIVPLVLGRVREIIPYQAKMQQMAWSRATLAFALCQAAAAYGFSYIFARTEGAYPLLFAMAATALVLALAVDLGTGVFGRAKSGH
jgi:predicted MFS family arabinose efflux permease